MDRWDELWAARDRLADLVRNDWGLWRTSRGTLERLAGSEHPTIAGRAGDLLTYWTEIRFGPAARLRAAVGDRMRWYDEPEEI
jgi:hypothetical protein